MTLVLSQAQVRELLPMERCADLVAEALVELSAGRAVNPLRRGMLLPDTPNLLGMMPGYSRDARALGLKVVGVFPDNHGTGLDSHQGIVALFDASDGRPTAIFDGSEITAIRTAAASAVATRALAREDAGDLAILGSGTQARNHLEAMRCARELRRVRVFSPSAENREAFARRESARTGLEVRACATAREAVEGADLVCTTTSSREPVVLGSWLADGAHVNAVGACMPKARELDSDAVRRSRLFTDCRESARNEAGDYLIPLAEGAISEAHLLGELGEVLGGTLLGRTSPADVTCFESLGVAVEDLVVARFLLERGRELGVGTEVDLGGASS